MTSNVNPLRTTNRSTKFSLWAAITCSRVRRFREYSRCLGTVGLRLGPGRANDEWPAHSEPHQVPAQLYRHSEDNARPGSAAPEESAPARSERKFAGYNDFQTN